MRRGIPTNELVVEQQQHDRADHRTRDAAGIKFIPIADPQELGENEESQEGARDSEQDGRNQADVVLPRYQRPSDEARDEANNNCSYQ